MNIKEVIVVEGKNDANVLQSFFDCDIIITNGTNINETTLLQIKQLQEKRGIIIFTDPDYPGEYIRKTINQRISGCKNAYIEKSKAKTPKKVGVEHASKHDLEEALAHVFTYQEHIDESISWEEYCAFGFLGRVDSATRRECIATKLHIGKPNGKTLYKRLNMLRLTKADIKDLISEEEYDGKKGNIL